MCRALRASVPRLVGGAHPGGHAARGALARSLETRVRALASDAMVFGADAPRLANTSNFAMPGLAAETAVMALDLEGVAVSSGSACSSGKVTPSPVLAAMGAGARARRGDPREPRLAHDRGRRRAFPRGFGALLARTRARLRLRSLTAMAATPRHRVRRACEREVQIRLRHRHRDASSRRRDCPKTSSASSRPRRTSRNGCSNGGWRPFAAGWT